MHWFPAASRFLWVASAVRLACLDSSCAAALGAGPSWRGQIKQWGWPRAIGCACLSRTKEHRERSCHTRWLIQQGCEDSSLGEEGPRPKVYTYLAQWGQKTASRGLLFPTEWCIHPILICYIILEENSLFSRKTRIFQGAAILGRSWILAKFLIQLISKC